MPCLDQWTSDHDYHDKEMQKRERLIENLEASLCAILTVLERSNDLKLVVSQIDEKEAGVTIKQILSWWTSHKRKDKARREREAAEAEREKALAAAKVKVAKMSSKEREAMLEAIHKALRDEPDRSAQLKKKMSDLAKRRTK